MGTPSFARLSLEEMIARICRVLREKDAPTTPPYSLILGAGASAGVVPMTRELVNACIPDWLLHQLDEDDLPKPLRSQTHPTEDKALLKQRAQHFWKDFHARNKDRRDAFDEKIATFTLDAAGLPTDSGLAYRAVFDRAALGGFEDTARMRRFFRQLTIGAEGKVKLNGTHFYLASLLALQPRDSQRAEPSERYKARRPFARTILTTNFDPLLQVSLQLVNLLYSTIDQPDLLQLDLTGEADHTAIQLVHVHGSIHRPYLANTQAELAAMRDRHAASLAGFLGQHGVIVLGSGGWEDCLTEALRRCTHFPHGLFWLGRDEKALPEPIVTLLERSGGFFVKIDDASEFMAQLYAALAPGLELPELLVEPLVMLRREMEKVDLSSVSPVKRKDDDSDPGGSTPVGNAAGPKSPPSGIGAGSGADVTPQEVLKKNLDLLSQAHAHFFARKSEGEVQQQIETVKASAGSAGGIDQKLAPQLLRQADLRYSEESYTTALGLYDALIESGALQGPDLALALFRRGYCYEQAGEPAKTVADYTRVIEMPDAPADRRAKALHNRGVRHGESGEMAKEMADYTRVIEMPDAPAEQRAGALFNRGVRHGEAGETAKAIADYTRVIEMLNAPAEQRAMALLNRAIRHGGAGEPAKEMADYTRVIEMPDAPAGERANALLNRGVANYGAGDMEEARQDWEAAMALPGAIEEVLTLAKANLALLSPPAPSLGPAAAAASPPLARAPKPAQRPSMPKPSATRKKPKKPEEGGGSGGS